MGLSGHGSAALIRTFSLVVLYGERKMCVMTDTNCQFVVSCRDYGE